MGRVPVPAPVADPLTIAGRSFPSRLILGTAKFPSRAALRESIVAAGSVIVTVALRRVDFSRPEEDVLDAVDRQHVLVMTNTSGAAVADEAVRLARLARAGGLRDWIKVEVVADPRHLLPDPIETLRACETLVAEGFTVLPYIHADPVLAKRLEDVGVAAVMPLGAPIGTNQGLRTRDSLGIIIEQARVPVIVDAGLGRPSHAAEALEMGADAVLLNTAIATADDPPAMARAFRLAVEAGRLAYLAGPSPVKEIAEASSPLTGFLGGVGRKAPPAEGIARAGR